MDHNAMNTFAVTWWNTNQIRQRSIDMGGNANVPGTDKSYCLPLQQWAFRRIMTEAYFVEGFTWALMFWKDGFITDADDAATIERKLDRVGEDAYCYLTSAASSEWKDAIGSMGTVDASLNFLPPFYASAPGDWARCGPAPSLEFMIAHDLPPDGIYPDVPVPPEPPPSGDFAIAILDYTETAVRSSGKGCLVTYNAMTANPLVELTLDLEDDGEPGVTVHFSPDVGQDGRYIAAIAFKPVVNGTYPLRLTGKDSTGAIGESDGSQLVTVVE